MDEVCDSFVLIPGAQVLSKGTLAIFYFLALVYMFLGINVISDIFMTSIERITATKKIVKVIDDKTKEVIKTKKVPVWNPTIANLSLMALGSSAPEILLAVIETITGLAM